MQTIESRVKQVAQSKGIATISELARKAQLNPKTVRRVWGCDMPRFLLARTLVRLCHALDAGVGDLLVFVERED